MSRTSRITALQTLTALAVAAVFPGFAACSSSAASSSGSEAPLIEGTVDTAHPAVGAIATRRTMADGEIVDSFCTATLIAPRLVVTAEHCFLDGRTDLAFVLGPIGTTVLTPERRDPERVVNITRVDFERAVEGGGLGLGSDVAIAELEEPIDDVEPARLGSLEPADVGARFEAIGYGVHDVRARRDGKKRAGTLELRALEGTYLPIAFPSFDDYVRKTGLSVEDARAEYDGFALLRDYEVFAGGRAGDAQGCEGDSGGPLLRTVDGKATLYGVASFVVSTLDSPCEGGIVYATFGPETRAFIERYLTP